MNLDLRKGKKRKVLQLLLYNYYYCNYIVTFFNPSSLSGDQTSTCIGPVQFYIATGQPGDCQYLLFSMILLYLFQACICQGKISHIIIPANET